MDIANQFVHCCTYCNLGNICVKIFSVLIINFVVIFALQCFSANSFSLVVYSPLK